MNKRNGVCRVMIAMLVAVMVCAAGNGAIAANIYVYGAEGDDSNTGGWSDPVKTIQRGVDLAEDGDRVWVDEGTYSTGGRVMGVTNRIYIDKNITLSAAAKKKVIVKGNRTLGDDAVRCLYVNWNTTNVRVNGITFMYGGTSASDQGGGARILGDDTIVSNCVFRDCIAASQGGGVAGLVVGDLNDIKCRVVNSIIQDCTVTNDIDSLTDSGGGVSFLRLVNCTVSGNHTKGQGGGVYKCAVHNSVIRDNYAANSGGGAAYSELYNCLIAENVSGGSVGGIWYGEINECTVANNQSRWSPSGAKAAECYNSIFWSSDSGDLLSDMKLVYYSCSPDGVTHGEHGCITNNPQFVSNYRLRKTSPCIGIGSTVYVYTQYGDLLGNPRVVDGKVDMGAYQGGVTPCIVPNMLLLFD